VKPEAACGLEVRHMLASAAIKCNSEASSSDRCQARVCGRITRCGRADGRGRAGNARLSPCAVRTFRTQRGRSVMPGVPAAAAGVPLSCETRARTVSASDALGASRRYSSYAAIASGLRRRRS